MTGKLRNESGFSLPTIVALGVVASLWMLGTAGLVVPATYRLTSERTADLCRTSAEASLDWAIQQLSSTQTRTNIDNQTNYAVPSSVMADYTTTSGTSNFTGTVTVQNVAPPNAVCSPTNAAYTSYLYDRQCDPSQNTAIASQSNGWRVVTATVKAANGLSAHTVRVILKPMYQTAPDGTTTTWVPGPAVPIFNYSAFGWLQINGSGNMVTNSYDSRVTTNPTSFQNTGGDVATNGSFSVSGNSAVGGNVSVFNATSSNGTPPTVVSGSSNSYVYGDITANGNVSGFTQGSNVGGTVSADQSNAQQQLPPTPTAPTGATNLGAISLSGNNTMTLTAGNYVVSSIAISGNGKLNIDSSAGPVNIYVQGSGSSNGIQISGNGIFNGAAPTNLRIYYNGSGSTKVSGNGNFTGVIYAPNSAVAISGNGSQYGAVVGNTVSFNGNGTFHYDRALAADSTLMWNPPVAQTTTNYATNIGYYQAVSWQEFNPLSNY